MGSFTLKNGMRILFRKEFAFEKWNDFDQELFDRIYNDDSQEREFTHKIFGYDNNPKMCIRDRYQREGGVYLDQQISSQSTD